MTRGEVWWASYPRAAPNPHPVVLLSWDSHLAFREQVTVAQVTSTQRGLDAEVLLDKRDGLPRVCVANLDAIVTISRNLLVERICLLSTSRLDEIDRAIYLALGMRLPCELM